MKRNKNFIAWDICLGKDVTALELTHEYFKSILFII